MIEGLIRRFERKDVERDLIWSAVASRIEDELGNPILSEMLPNEGNLIITGPNFGKVRAKDKNGEWVVLDMDEDTKVSVTFNYMYSPTHFNSSPARCTRRNSHPDPSML